MKSKIYIKVTADNGVSITWLYDPIQDGDLKGYINNPNYEIV